MQKYLTLTAVLVPLLLGCEDTTGPGQAGQVSVRFQAVTASGASLSQAGMPPASFDHTGGTGSLTLTGSNGTLVIEDIRLIVSEIELERADGECFGENDDDCEEFEGGPFLVNLLDGTADEVVSALVPAGTYTELEFEVEDLEVDEDDDSAERQATEQILNQMRQAYAGFPSGASMVVHGTFNGEPFTVYFDAEIEVEQEFPTPFRVPEDGAITVLLSPELWFRQGSDVMDLRALNGQTVDFEAEFENGVVEIEFDD